MHGGGPMMQGQMHGPGMMHSPGMMHGPGMQDGMHPGMPMGACPMAPVIGNADAKVKKLKNGAVLTVTTKDPQKVAEIQAAVEHMAEHITSGHMPPGAPANAPASAPAPAK